jgi:hypothetical protein
MKQFSEALGVEYIPARKAFFNEAGCLNRIGDELMTGDAFHLAPARIQIFDRLGRSGASARCSSTETRRSRRRARFWPASAGAVSEMTFPNECEGLAASARGAGLPPINPLPSSDRTEDNHRARL